MLQNTDTTGNYAHLKQAQFLSSWKASQTKSLPQGCVCDDWVSNFQKCWPCNFMQTAGSNQACHLLILWPNIGRLPVLVFASGLSLTHVLVLHAWQGSAPWPSDVRRTSEHNLAEPAPAPWCSYVEFSFLVLHTTRLAHWVLVHIYNCLLALNSSSAWPPGGDCGTKRGTSAANPVAPAECCS